MALVSQSSVKFGKKHEFLGTTNFIKNKVYVGGVEIVHMMAWWASQQNRSWVLGDAHGC